MRLPDPKTNVSVHEFTSYEVYGDTITGFCRFPFCPDLEDIEKIIDFSESRDYDWKIDFGDFFE